MSPLFSAPKFSVRKCCVDWLHAMDLGVSADFLGGLFSFIVDKKMEGDTAKDRCCNLFKDIQSYYKRSGSQSKLPCLTPLMLRKQKAKFPKLRAKAGEARDLIAFAKEISEVYLAADAFEEAIKHTAHHLKNCYDCLSRDGWSPQVFLRASKKFGTLLVELGRFPNQKYFKVKPKLHMVMEIGRQGRRPTDTWTYRDESFGHVLSKHAQRRGGKFSIRTTSRTMLQKFCAANKKLPTLA